MRTKILILILFSGLVSTVPALSGEKVVARVNTSIITTRDLDEAIDRLIPRATFHGNVSGEKRKELQEQALASLIERELLYQDAVSTGMKADRKIIKERLGGVRDRFQSKKEYNRALEEAGITEAQLSARIEKEVLVEQYIEAAFNAPARMSEESLKKYYEENRSKFLQPASVRLRMISAKDEKKIKDAYAKVTSGEDFDAVASRMSEDNYRIKGGDIGYVHRGRIYPKLEDAAFKMKKGEISGLLFEENTWFILKMEDSIPERQVLFEETKDKLRKELERKRVAELKDQRILDLRQKAKIEILMETKE